MATRKSPAARSAAAKAPARTTPAKRAAAVKTKAAPRAATAEAAKESGAHKQKLVRDSFTIPKNEYAVLSDLKARAAKLTRPAKKGEILRAGIGALNAMSDKAFLATLGAVPSLKTGRPKRAKANGKAAAEKA